MLIMFRSTNIVLCDVREPWPDHPWERYLLAGWRLERECLRTGDFALANFPDGAIVERRLRTISRVASALGVIVSSTDPPNANGALTKSPAPTMRNTAPEDFARLAQRSSELRIACTALSESELKEWLQTKHSRQITKETSDVGGKILAICPEFVCIERPDGSRVVESTAEVDRALAIALFGISDAGSSDIRLALAHARAKSWFVIESESEPDVNAPFEHYRCDP